MSFINKSDNSAEGAVSAGLLPPAPGSVDRRIRLPHWFLLVFSFPAMLLGILITIEFVLTRGSVADPDIWWHLRNAEFLVKFHQLPRQDFYSFTASGHSWISTEWLAEIPYYLAWRVAGLTGIEIVLFSVICFIFLALFYLCYRESGNIKASVAACCAASFLA